MTKGNSKNITNDIYKECFLEIFKALTKQNHSEYEDLIAITKMKLKSSTNLCIRNVINFYDTSGIKKDHFCLLDLILFCILTNSKINFTGVLKYLNKEFELVESRDMIYTAEFHFDRLIFFFDTDKFDAVPAYDTIESLIFRLGALLFFKSENTDEDAFKTAPLIVKPMKTKNGFESKLPNAPIEPVYTTYDLDALVGPLKKGFISKSIIGNFKIDCSIKKTKKSHQKILSKNFPFLFDNRLINISKCNYKSLGFFDITLGKLGLYIVYPECEENRNRLERILEITVEVLKEGKLMRESQIAVACGLHIILDPKKEKISGTLASVYQPIFFKHIDLVMEAENFPFTYFIELLGNKNNTRLLSLDSLLEIAQKDLNFDLLEGVVVDVCEESFVKSKHLIAPKTAFFDSFNLKSNYHPLICPDIKNLSINHVSVKYNDSTLVQTISTKGFLLKSNMYSSIEDFTLNSRSTTFLPSISIKKFEALCIHNKEIKLSYEMKKIQALCEIELNEPITYRKEVRVPIRFIIDALSIIKDDDYLFIPNAKVEGCIRRVSREYLEMFNRNSSVSNIFHFSNIEIIFEQFFLCGGTNPHTIYKPLREEVKTYLKDKDFVNCPSVRLFSESINTLDISPDIKFDYLDSLLKYLDTRKTNPYFTDFNFVTIKDGLHLVLKELISAMEELSDMYGFDLTKKEYYESVYLDSIQFTDIYQFCFEDYKYDKNGKFISIMKYLKLKFNVTIDFAMIKEMFIEGKIQYFFPVDEVSRVKKVKKIHYEQGTLPLYMQKKLRANEIIEGYTRKPIVLYPALSKRFFMFLFVYREEEKVFWPRLEKIFFIGLAHHVEVQKIQECCRCPRNKAVLDLRIIFGIVLYDPLIISVEHKIKEVQALYVGLNINLEFKEIYKWIHDYEKIYYKSKDVFGMFSRLCDKIGYILSGMSCSDFKELVQKYPIVKFHKKEIINFVKIPTSELEKFFILDASQKENMLTFEKNWDQKKKKIAVTKKTVASASELKKFSILEEKEKMLNFEKIQEQEKLEIVSIKKNEALPDLIVEKKEILITRIKPLIVVDLQVNIPNREGCILREVVCRYSYLRLNYKGEIYKKSKFRIPNRSFKKMENVTKDSNLARKFDNNNNDGEYDDNYADQMDFYDSLDDMPNLNISQPLVSTPDSLNPFSIPSADDDCLIINRTTCQSLSKIIDMGNLVKPNQNELKKIEKLKMLELEKLDMEQLEQENIDVFKRIKNQKFKLIEIEKFKLNELEKVKEDKRNLNKLEIMKKQELEEIRKEKYKLEELEKNEFKKFKKGDESASCNSKSKNITLDDDVDAKTKSLKVSQNNDEVPVSINVNREVESDYKPYFKTQLKIDKFYKRFIALVVERTPVSSSILRGNLFGGNYRPNGAQWDDLLKIAEERGEILLSDAIKKEGQIITYIKKHDDGNENENLKNCGEKDIAS